MIVRVTCSPSETLDPMDVSDLGHALESLGFTVDLVHVDRIHDPDGYAGVIEKHSPLMADMWRRKQEN